MAAKVLHVCETAIGGVATFLRMLDAHAPEGTQNLFLVPDSHARDLPQTMELRQYPSGARGLKGLMAMLGAMRKVLREDAPDIVFFHSTFSLAGLVFARLLGWRGPCLYCAHGWAISRYDSPNSLKSRVVRLIEGRVPGLADAVVNISGHDQDLAHEFGYRGQQVLIQNAVEPAADAARDDLFSDAPEDIHLLFVGRIDRQKGLDILLPAFARARSTRPDLQLHVIGETVRADGAAVDIPEGVTTIGWVDKSQIDDWYRSADALVVPSRWEGFGLVVPEALRNGTPALVSDRGALPGLVVPGQVGDVFPLSEDALTDCLTGLEKAALRAQRPACRARFETQFSAERWTEEFGVLYARLTDKEISA